MNKQTLSQFYQQQSIEWDKFVAQNPSHAELIAKKCTKFLLSSKVQNVKQGLHLLLSISNLALAVSSMAFPLQCSSSFHADVHI